jgi:hypothetical protein
LSSLTGFLTRLLARGRGLLSSLTGFLTRLLARSRGLLSSLTRFLARLLSGLTRFLTCLLTRFLSGLACFLTCFLACRSRRGRTRRVLRVDRRDTAENHGQSRSTHGQEFRQFHV